MRLNWDTTLGAMRYDNVATYCAAFHVISEQSLSDVLTKQEYIARAEAAYNKLGPDAFIYEDDDGNPTREVEFAWEDGNKSIPDDLLQLAYNKVACPHELPARTPDDAAIIRRQGTIGMFTRDNCGICEDSVEVRDGIRMLDFS